MPFRGLCCLFAVFLCGCKIEFIVPEGGSVESASGTYVCGAGEVCEIDIMDADFDELFRARPEPGFTFVGWRRGSAFCPRDNKPCSISALPLGGSPLEAFLASDAIFSIRPDFAVPNKWTAANDMAGASGAISTCVVGGDVYVFGLGWMSTPNRVVKYDSVEDTWTLLNGVMPVPQGWAVAGNVDDKCYVIGGAPMRRGAALLTVSEFDPDTEQWTAKASMREGRTLAGAAVLDGKIYVVGGGDLDSFTPGHRSSIAIYDPSKDSWQRGAAMPTSRILLAAAAVDGKIYAIGGTEDSGAAFSGVVERYDPASNRWSAVASLPSGRRGLTAVALGGDIYVIAGAAAGPMPTTAVYRYDPGSNSWTSRAGLMTSRWGHGSVALDGHIITFGGFSSATDSMAPSIRAVEIYTP